MVSPAPTNNSTNEQPSKVSAAFVAAWSEIRTLGHDAKNKHLGNKYTSYDKIIVDLRSILTKHKLAILPKPVVIEGCAAIHTLLIHEDGGTMDLGTMAVPVKKANDPQAYGSSNTYALRYAMRSVFGIPTGEDDDGNLGAAAPAEQADPRTQAAADIEKWCGMKGDDLKGALADVVRVSGTKEPTELIAYVNAHKGEDFITHIQNNTKQEQETNG